MIRNIILLALNDFAISLKNKTIVLVLFIPLFVYVSLKLVDGAGADFVKINIGLVQNEKHDPVILQSIELAQRVFTVHRVSNEEEGTRWLTESKIDGLLLRNSKEHAGLVLVVLKKESMKTLLIVENLSALQKAAEGNNGNWISAIKPLHNEGIQQQTLPTWILMLVLLVGFIILPAQVAEEKEKKLLLALLQTPVREMEWLAAKLVLGMALTFIALLFLHLLGQFNLHNVVSYIAFIGVGGFCFSSCGICLGLLCRNQASARTLGVIFYLPLLLPSALSEFSVKLAAAAPFLPSYYFFKPIKSILLQQGDLSKLCYEWFGLLLFGLLTSILSHRLIKRRWLM